MNTQRFSIDQKTLAHVLASMQPICTKRSPLEATSSILFQTSAKELVIKSTDLEISLQISCPLNDIAESDHYSFLVSGKRLFDLTRELDGSIHFEVDQQQVLLNAGAAQLSLNVKDAHEFPPFPERIENLMHLQSKQLLAMLDKVIFVVPQNNSNPALNGLFIEINQDGMTMTATDGHCLAQAQTTHYTLPTQRSWLLPRRALTELKKILESVADETIFLGVCGNQLVFSGESFNFFTKMLNDTFPQYKQILEHSSFQERVALRADLIKTLRRANCLLSGQFIATQFILSDNEIAVSMHNKEVGRLQERIRLIKGVEGELDIRFYAPYVLNGLNALTGDTVSFYLQNKSRPLIIKSTDEIGNFTYLVMPVSPTTQA